MTHVNCLMSDRNLSFSPPLCKTKNLHVLYNNNEVMHCFIHKSAEFVYLMKLAHLYMKSKYPIYSTTNSHINTTIVSD